MFLNFWKIYSVRSERNRTCSVRTERSLVPWWPNNVTYQIFNDYILKNFYSSILAKSKFYGNSTSAILEGEATLCLLPRGEEYIMTLPYAHCKGILMGTMTMELGGKVSIVCSKTGYTAELEFKLRVSSLSPLRPPPTNLPIKPIS